MHTRMQKHGCICINLKEDHPRNIPVKLGKNLKQESTDTRTHGRTRQTQCHDNSLLAFGQWS